ncbi:DUF4153 domain-containing protein [Nocardia sp. NPDC052566]|uniref:DUF4153 domain-containing protein n=1 Tax=Nocardia sp. NPDC052566 TaxID=3364330 RepID=UPI0037C95032
MSSNTVAAGDSIAEGAARVAADSALLGAPDANASTAVPATAAATEIGTDAAASADVPAESTPGARGLTDRMGPDGAEGDVAGAKSGPSADGPADAKTIGAAADAEGSTAEMADSELWGAAWEGVSPSPLGKDERGRPRYVAPPGMVFAPGGVPHVVMPPPRWRRVSSPPGLVTAAAVAGVGAAVLVPLDRPGIGWVLAGAVAAGAVYTVDRRARRSAGTAEESSVSVGGEGFGSRGDGKDGAVDAAEGTAPTTALVSDAPGHAGPEPVPDAAEQIGPASVGSASTADRVVAAATEVKEADGQRDTAAQWAPESSALDWGRMWWTAAALGLLAVGTFRAAGWLFVLCVLGACAAGSLAVVGKRSSSGTLFDVVAVPLAAVAAIPWVYARLDRIRDGASTRNWRLGTSVVATVVLLAIFVPLLSSADATFASLLDGLTPRVDGGSVFQWIFLFTVFALGSFGAMYVLAGPPPAASAAMQRVPGRSLRRAEWALPVGALTVLFAVFVGAQFVALFGGDGYVQRTAGLTYAEYARSGFWQLAAVTVLTLAVIVIVLRWAAQDSAVDRLWLRVLLCAVSALGLIIVASALGRMWTYQQAYGFTVLRLLVETCELWLGLVYLLVIAASLRLRRAWLARATIGTAIATLLALAVLNPEALIADKNIDRAEHGKRLDTDYLTTLSPDVLPALERLPEPLRTTVLIEFRDKVGHDTWQSWNLSRANAR